jgi:KipI family sensor histidine kinase inhibitor
MSSSGSLPLLIKPMGPDHVLIDWKVKVLSEDVVRHVIKVATFLQRRFKDRSIQIAGSSILVTISTPSDIQTISAWLQEFDLDDAELGLPETILHTIHIKYDTSHSSDLLKVASFNGMTIEECIALHHGQEYKVLMLGFMPGFVYLGTLPEAIQIPRKPTPDIMIPAGSVAIANAFTGIYPIGSPGGWHVIGSTSYKGFNAYEPPYSRFNLLDSVRFVPM